MPIFILRSLPYANDMENKDLAINKMVFTLFCLLSFSVSPVSPHLLKIIDSVRNTHFFLYA